METVKKFAEKSADNWGAQGVTIAFLGDSVTQGCFEIYKKDDGNIETVFDKNCAYHTYLQKIFTVLYPNVPVNIINAGVSGGSAPHGLNRLERDVISHRPDIAVVCFGLNDSGAGCGGVEVYKDALDKIFKRLTEEKIETVFMTPNMMCTKVSCHLKDERERAIAAGCAEIQNNDILEMYLNAAKDICAANGVKVCDVYSKWKRLSQSGVDITELLANKINHPSREMNWLFAFSLAETILS